MLAWLLLPLALAGSKRTFSSFEEMEAWHASPEGQRVAERRWRRWERRYQGRLYRAWPARELCLHTTACADGARTVFQRGEAVRMRRLAAFPPGEERVMDARLYVGDDIRPDPFSALPTGRELDGLVLLAPGFTEGWGVGMGGMPATVYLDGAYLEPVSGAPAFR
jgi:hypothetical protein